jgi:hypothetical protein
MLRRFLAIFVLVVPLLFVVSSSAMAATRFVATTGSDEAGNTCLSSVDPCQTVQWAITKAEAGDTVSIGPGTYVGEFQLNKELTLVGQGPSTLLEGEPTVQRPVFVRADSTFEDLRIRGGLNESSAMDAFYMAGPETEVVFDHVTAEQAPDATEGRNAVYVGGGNLTMKDSTITGVGTTCLWVAGSATLTGSTITMTPGVRGGGALRVIEGGTADLVGTTVTDAGERGEALDVEGGTVTATDSAFYASGRSVGARASSLSMTRDKVTAQEAGLVLHGGATAELRDSLIAPPPGGQIGADVMIETESLPVTPSLTIVGSTLYANGPSRYRAARAILAYSPIQARIVNTILRANGAGPSGNVSDIEAEGGSWSVTNSAYTTVFGSGPPTPGSGTNIAAVPGFAGQEAGNYQLTPADSALLDRGDPAQVIAGETDLAGQPRVLPAACNGAPDIGAYELARTNPCPSRSLGGPTSQPEKPVAPAVLGDETPARPVLSGVRVKQRRQGPTLEFRLSEPGTVSVTISKAASHGAGKGKSTSYRSFARFTQDAGMGRSVIPLTPHLGAAKPTPDMYRLTVIATAGGLRSARHTVSAFKFAAP